MVESHDNYLKGLDMKKCTPSAGDNCCDTVYLQEETKIFECRATIHRRPVAENSLAVVNRDNKLIGWADIDGDVVTIRIDYHTSERMDIQLGEKYYVEEKTPLLMLTRNRSCETISDELKEIS